MSVGIFPRPLAGWALCRVPAAFDLIVRKSAGRVDALLLACSWIERSKMVFFTPS